MDISIKKKIFIFLYITSMFSNLHSNVLCDVNLVGHLKDSSSISRHSSSFAYSFYPEIPFNFFQTHETSSEGFPPFFEDIIASKIRVSLYRNLCPQKSLTGITIYADSIVPVFWRQYASLPNRSTIRYAYCVTERTVVHKEWVDKLNYNFDAILVPDEWLVGVFEQSGLKLPIFVLPEVLDLHSLLKKPVKQERQNPFIFGFSGGCWQRKNHQLIIDAFVEEFGNDPNVILKIHSRYSMGFERIAEISQQTSTSNIILDQRTLSREEYDNFLASLDCYVTVAKGEGFSIIPREVLALGIPCIVSNNTAQTTICNTGYVYSVPSDILEPSFLIYGKQRAGFEFNSTIQDVRQALRTVYTNYNDYLALAHQGREWVKQYLPENLKQRYQTLVNPKTVTLGGHNEITDDAIITNSKDLFERYKILCDLASTSFIKTHIKKEPNASSYLNARQTRSGLPLHSKSNIATPLTNQKNIRNLHYPVFHQRSTAIQ